MGLPSRGLGVGRSTSLGRLSACFCRSHPMILHGAGRGHWPNQGSRSSSGPLPTAGPRRAWLCTGLWSLPASGPSGGPSTGLRIRDSQGRHPPLAALVRESRRKVAPLSELSASAARQTAPAAAPPAIGRFGAAHRLVAKREFTAALRTGRRLRGEHVQLIASPRFAQAGLAGLAAEELPLLPSRLGLSVSKGVGNSPQRARLRRLLREAFRGLRGRLKGSCDVVVIAKTPWPDAALADVSAEMAGLLSRMRLTAQAARPAGETR